MRAVLPTPRRGGAPTGCPELTWHRSYTAGLLVVALFLVYLQRNNGSFDSIQALGISNAALPLALVAVGETFVILTNGIDLSVGSIVTLSNVTVAVLASHGQGVLGLVLAVGIGAGAGLANGLIVSYLRIAPLIATLATSSIFLGFALIILASPGGTVPTWLPDWTSGQRGESIGGSRSLRSGSLLAMAVGWIILRRTPFGIDLQALGGSESASRSAGINVTRVRILAYVAAGVCSSLAGIVLAGLTQSRRPDDRRRLPARRDRRRGDRRHEPRRGRRHDPGTVLGAIALSLLSAVLLVSGISTNYQYIVTGAIVIGALLAHSMQSKLVARAAKTIALRGRRGRSLTAMRQARSYVRPMEVVDPVRARRGGALRRADQGAGLPLDRPPDRALDHGGLPRDHRDRPDARAAARRHRPVGAVHDQPRGGATSPASSSRA